jgi:hypothetical protein
MLREPDGKGDRIQTNRTVLLLQSTSCRAAAPALRSLQCLLLRSQILSNVSYSLVLSVRTA